MQINDLIPGRLFRETLLKMAGSQDKLEAIASPRLLQLLDYLETLDSTRQAFCNLVGRELWLCSRPGATVKVWVDWYYRAPLVDGLPVTHYRIEIVGRGQSELRAKSIQEASDAILKAIS